MRPPIITLLSDYGLVDDFVGVCRGVIATICPEALVIDITHGIERHDVRGGALVLRDALAYMPVGVHVAIVDPDVGAERRAVALRLGDGRVLIGPDNGVLWPAATAAGGAVEAIDIARSPFRLEPVSATFHGRDIFVAVAAQIARGTPFSEAGEPADRGDLVELELPRPLIADGRVLAHVLHVDRFGNLQLDVGHDDLADTGLRMGATAELEPPGRASQIAQYVRTFADVPIDALLVYEDAHRMLSVAVNQGSAAELLRLAVKDELRIRPG